MMLAATELLRRNRNHAASFNVTARRLAEFLESGEAEELLLTQRLRDRESRSIRLGIVARVQVSDALPEQQSPGQAAEHVAAAGDEEMIGELYGEV
jgi:hypothetical protein